MRVIIEVECDEESGDWVVSGAEFTPLAVTHGTGATVPAALRDFAQALEEYGELVQDGVAAGYKSDVPIWQAIEPFVTERETL